MEAALPVARQRRNVAVLGICQALLLANGSILITLNGLAGYALAPDKRLATLPVTSVVVGGALTTYFASLLMRRIGRRAGFSLGIAMGMVGAIVCSIALSRHAFWPLCIGAALLGGYNAFGGYYRFAAAEGVARDWRARAISYVLVGGLLGGIIGPATTRLTVNLSSTTYLASYLSLLGFQVVALGLLRLLDIPPPGQAAGGDSGRPLSVLIRQPPLIVAAVAAAFGYGVMSLLMTATPLAMSACGHHYGSTTTVISSHVVAMFAPSLFTGDLVRRFGVSRVLAAGVACNLACVAAAVSGNGVANFWAALVLLGVGWNFLFVGGTNLLAEIDQPAERARAQGANDLFIAVITAASSFASGAIVERSGWQTLNYAALPFILAVAAAVAWIWRRPADSPAAT